MIFLKNDIKESNNVSNNALKGYKINFKIFNCKCEEVLTHRITCHKRRVSWHFQSNSQKMKLF